VIFQRIYSVLFHFFISLFIFPSLSSSLNSQDHFRRIFSAHIFNFFSLQFLSAVSDSLSTHSLPIKSIFGLFYSAFRGAYFHFILFFYLQISAHFLTCFLLFSRYFILFYLSFLFSILFIQYAFKVHKIEGFRICFSPQSKPHSQNKAARAPTLSCCRHYPPISYLQRSFFIHDICSLTQISQNCFRFQYHY
jgi:hypothetical protein